MKKASPLKDAKRFKWTLTLGDRLAVRLYAKDDGSAAKITYSADLTPAEIIEAAGWLKKVGKDMKKLKSDGWSNKLGRILGREAYKG